MIDSYTEQIIGSIPDLSSFLKQGLDELAAYDELFAVTYQKKNKSIEECEKYIIQQMREMAQKHRQSNIGFVSGRDEDLINLAVHYYDEDNLKVEEPKVPKPTPIRHTEPERVIQPKKPEAVQLSLF